MAMTPGLAQTLFFTATFFAAVMTALKEFVVSPSPMSTEVVDFTTVKKMLANPDQGIVLIDVREADEFAQGHIPSAVNMPWFAAPEALGLDALEFEKQLGFKKPQKSQRLLFYCRSGNRSLKASERAAGFGYGALMNYVGSYREWAELGGPVEI